MIDSTTRGKMKGTKYPTERARYYAEWQWSGAGCGSPNSTVMGWDLLFILDGHVEVYWLDLIRRIGSLLITLNVLISLFPLTTYRNLASNMQLQVSLAIDIIILYDHL